MDMVMRGFGDIKKDQMESVAVKQSNITGGA